MPFASPDALERARRVKFMIFDVDGVLTDGNLWYGPSGEEMKAFHAFDGHGVKMLGESGVRLAILSGRKSPAGAARARELGIEHVLRGGEGKRHCYQGGLKRLRPDAHDNGYPGDRLVGFPGLGRYALARPH